MKRFMYISGLIMWLAITLVIGIYIGGQLAQAQVWSEVGMGLDANNKQHEIKVPETSSGEPIRQITKGVPVDWLLYQANYYAAKGEKYMKFSVTTGDPPNEVYLDPRTYKIYIEGMDPEKQRIRCLDRVPIWP
jgi:hypothetical protein